MVIAMLSMMLLSFGVVALLFICMLRNAARREHQVEALLEEISQQPQPAPPAAAPAEAEKVALEPWEKQADWWKG
jgi:hypothetical protein